MIPSSHLSLSLLAPNSILNLAPSSLYFLFLAFSPSNSPLTLSNTFSTSSALRLSPSPSFILPHSASHPSASNLASSSAFSSPAIFSTASTISPARAVFSLAREETAEAVRSLSAWNSCATGRAERVPGAEVEWAWEGERDLRDAVGARAEGAEGRDWRGRETAPSLGGG